MPPNEEFPMETSAVSAFPVNVLILVPAAVCRGHETHDVPVSALPVNVLIPVPAAGSHGHETHDVPGAQHVTGSGGIHTHNPGQIAKFVTIQNTISRELLKQQDLVGWGCSKVLVVHPRVLCERNAKTLIAFSYNSSIGFLLMQISCAACVRPNPERLVLRRAW